MSEYPVVFVSWYDARAFCRWLSRREGREYRLPTEEEWEYACRCGTQLTYGCTSDPSALLEYAWLRGNAGGRPHPVGTKMPNAWGLHDMLGNVWEWTASRMDPSLLVGTEFVGQDVAHIRGGSYENTPASARCAARWAGWPLSKRTATVGFRVLLKH